MRFRRIACLLAGSVAALSAARAAVACPPEKRCEASSEREALMQRKFTDLAASGSSGGRLSTTRVHGSDADDTGLGMALTLWGQSSRYAAYRTFSFRDRSFAFIGGGALGFEGGIGGDLATGVRAPFGRYHGPVLRLGLRGHLLGNDKLYTSMLEIPQVQIGYQFLRNDEAFEIAGRAGAVLIGRFNTGDDAERKLGKSMEVGGHMGLHFDPVHLEIEHAHVLLQRDLGDVDLASAQLCSDAWVLQLCVDARVGRGDAVVPGIGALPGPVTSYYGGFGVGMKEGIMTAPEPGRRGRGRKKPLEIAE